MTKFRLKFTFTRSKLFLLVYSLIGSLYFLLLWSRQLVSTPTGIVAGWVGSWADGAVHLSYMSAFAFRSTFPLNHPLFYGHPFSYSFVADMLGGYLLRLGLPHHLAWNFLGGFLCLILLFLLPWVYSQFSSLSRALVASLLWFFSGGLGFIYFFQDVAQTGFLTTITHLPQEYTHIGSHYIEWINIISGELVPQRAFLLGLITGLLILTLLWRIFATKVKLRHFLVLGLLLGPLPIIHAHTAIVMAILTLWIFLLTLRRHPFSYWMLTAFISLSVAYPLATHFIFPSTSESFFRLYPGWLAKSKDINWFWFWLINWGLFLPASFVGYFFLPSRQKLFFLPFYFLFFLSNLILFQPYDWDNSKIFTWIYLAFSLPATTLLFRLLQAKRLGLIAFSLLFLVFTFSGFLDALRLLDFEKLQTPMFTNEELDLASKVRELTSPDSVILTSDQHNHFIPTLTGRQILMGYRGWLWTYGLDYTTRETDIANIYSGSSQASLLLDHYSIDYVVIGPSEHASFEINLSYFSQFPLLLESPSYSIYSVSH